MVHSRSPRKILLDIDGTIGDINRRTYDWLVGFGFVPTSQRNHFVFDKTVFDTVPGITRRFIDEVMFQDRNYWLRMNLLPDAKWFCDSLSLLGEVHVVTNRDWYDDIEADTKQWLDNMGVQYTSLHCVGRPAPEEKAKVARQLGITFSVEDSPSNVEQLFQVSPCALYRPEDKTITNGKFRCFSENWGRSTDDNHYPVHHCTTYGEIVGFIRDTPGTIPDKKNMYGHFNRNWFGNAGMNFEDEFDANYYCWKTGKKVAIRIVGKPGSPFHPYLGEDDVVDLARKLRSEGHELQFSAMMPDELVTIQGHVMRSLDYLDLEYNDKTKGINMREAMKNPQRATGLKALHVLKERLSATSYDELMSLLDQYPDSVIEFAHYSVPTGDLNRQELIWEVRNY